MTTAKPILEQPSGDGLSRKLVLEMQNGEMAQPALYLRNILKTQDLAAWSSNPEGLRDWLASTMADYFRNLDVKIWCYPSIS